MKILLTHIARDVMSNRRYSVQPNILDYFETRQEINMMTGIPPRKIDSLIGAWRMQYPERPSVSAIRLIGIARWCERHYDV